MTMEFNISKNCGIRFFFPILFPRPKKHTNVVCFAIY